MTAMELFASTFNESHLARHVSGQAESKVFSERCCGANGACALRTSGTKFSGRTEQIQDGWTMTMIKGMEHGSLDKFEIS